MDNTRVERLKIEAGKLSLTIDSATAEALWAYADELLRWNQKVNLTAITDEAEVLEKHLLDSLTALPEVAGVKTLLDLGAGGGLPGIPLAIASPTLQATLVDTVAKKVGFLKHIAVRAPLTGRVRAIHARAEGDPGREKIPLAERVICRAFMDLSGFLPLGKAYLAPGGQLVAMLGRAEPSGAMEHLAASHGLRLLTVRELTLPLSLAPRVIATFGTA